MKNKILKLFLFATILTLVINCKKEDDNSSRSVNEFTIMGNTFNTPNGYLFLDNLPPPLTNAAFFVFTDGTFTQDGELSTSSFHGIKLTMPFGNTPVNSEQNVINNITNNTTYSVDDEALAITNISSYHNIVMVNGIQYGQPDEASANLYEVNTTGNGSITVNNFTVDLTARTGTVDCSYTLLDENGVSVTGQFDGTFDIINEF